MNWFLNEDIHLFNEGTHRRLYQKMGAHLTDEGVRCSVWAPNARRVSVVGDFEGWSTEGVDLSSVQSSGIWSGVVPNLEPGHAYKYRIWSHHGGYVVNKADPFAFATEAPPATGSVVSGGDYTWNDGDWMASRASRDFLRSPMSTYEVHLGSWARVPEDGNRMLTYEELATRLVPHVKRLGFTHVELLPVMEHPFYGSWGYQCSSYFAPTRRHGSPNDLKRLIDAFHREGIGVILDWVPSHFPTDEHGLIYFDGTHLYEHPDPRRGHQPDWNTAVFDYGRNEIRSFLLSSASYWLDEFHADGLRVDAVASMLYLDYSRPDGGWIPNQHGGRENLEAMAFLRDLNRAVHADFPGAVTIAEESTAWPMVSRPTEIGGLGFSMKWDMGWMHDTLHFMSREPVYRRFHQNELTFRAMYAFTENFVLSLSHDEVVHGKGSLWRKIPGDDWQKAAQLRLLFAYLYGMPGKKLLFMGSEIGQDAEWNHDRSLDWHLLDGPWAPGIMHCLGDLNRLHREVEPLHTFDFDPRGFEWVDCSDTDQSVIAFLRKSHDRSVLAAYNFTPVPRHNYRLGVPKAGRWAEVFNSDAPLYGGSGQGNMGGLETVPVQAHGHYQSLTTTLPPLAGLFFQWSES
ncbi:MAG: 1,4-alpha-glucan branching protein GlgB [Myxococcota bacterium]